MHRKCTNILKKWINCVLHHDAEVNESTTSIITVYENFVNNSYCTVRHHNQFFSGIQTDMAIEQDFM